MIFQNLSIWSFIGLNQFVQLISITFLFKKRQKLGRVLSWLIKVIGHSLSIFVYESLISFFFFFNIYIYRANSYKFLAHLGQVFELPQWILTFPEIEFWSQTFQEISFIIQLNAHLDFSHLPFDHN